MLLKSQIPLKPNNYSILSINRNRFRSPSRQSQNSSKSPRQLRKRFTPTVNKSFSAYEENTPIKFRSPSVDRTLKSSTAETGSKKRRNRSLKATTKISMFLEEREAQLDNGKTLMRKGNYKEAINYFNEIIRDDRTNFDAIYSRAVCFMHLKEHKMALPDLLLIEKENPMYDRQLYLALCSCFMLMTEMSTSLRYISKGIYKFPRFIEGLVLRGQIYVELQQFEKAMADFKKVLTYNSNETQSLIGLADSLNALGDYEGALEYIEKAIVIPQCYLSALLRRAKIQSEKEPEFALDDYNKYLSHKSEDPEAYLGKAMILFNLKQYSEAALCFEQVVKYDANQKYSEISIYHLGAIKIREKDFYGALHTFNRLDEGKELKGQKILRCYADAVIFMMKRKYKEGINLFSKLLKKEYTVLHEYKGNCYTYRAYGHNALNQHEKALSDLKKARNYLKLDNASKYNQKLSQGLLAASKKNYQSATKYFQKAHIIFPKNPEPEIYHAAILLKLAFDSKSADPSLLEESESLIFKASKKREIESEVYFFRSILRYLNGNPKEALEDCKLAIEKAEDNISEHYVFKGLINASLNLYQEAVQDFSIGYQLNEDQDIVLLYRGKCAYMMDDTTLAFTDFQKLCELNPKNLQYQIQKANLFILTGSYDDAIKALDEALEIDPQNLEAAYQKLKTCILMNDLEESCSQIRNVLEIKPSHKTAQFDLECLKYLK